MVKLRYNLAGSQRLVAIMQSPNPGWDYLGDLQRAIGHKPATIWQVPKEEQTPH